MATIAHVFFMFNNLRLELIVGFADIGGIVDHHCFKISFHDNKISVFVYSKVHQLHFIW